MSIATRPAECAKCQASITKLCREHRAVLEFTDTCAYCGEDYLTDDMTENENGFMCGRCEEEEEEEESE